MLGDLERPSVCASDGMTNTVGADVTGISVGLRNRVGTDVGDVVGGKVMTLPSHEAALMEPTVLEKVESLESFPMICNLSRKFNSESSMRNGSTTRSFTTSPKYGCKSPLLLNDRESSARS